MIFNLPHQINVIIKWGVKMQRIITKETNLDYEKAIKKYLKASTLNKIADIVIEKFGLNRKVLIIIGEGKSTEIGFPLALTLSKKGVYVNILLVEKCQVISEKDYYNECKNNNISIFTYDDNFNFQNYDVLIDDIYGLDTKTTMSRLAKNVINRINAAKGLVVSLYINSGLGLNNGIAEACVHSNLTISINAFYPGHFLNMAKDNIDKLVNVDVDMDFESKTYLLEDLDFEGKLPERKNYSNKGDFGLVGILGGSLEYSGSVKLASMSLAALTSGAGVARLIIPRSIAQSVLPHILESTIFPVKDENGQMVLSKENIDKALEKVTALLIGIGWGQNKSNEQILKYILDNYNIPIVIDADGLNVLAHINYMRPGVILTPHLKEFSRLTHLDINTINESPIEIAKKYAKDNQIILLLKGPTTIVTDGNTVYLIDKGCGGMASAGSGDVLSGILIGLLGFKNSTIKTVALAAYINGLAGFFAQGEKTSICMLASDTVSHIPDAVRYIQKDK